MKLVEGIPGFSSLAEDAEHTHFLLEDGRKTIHFDGCDWKENPFLTLLRLEKLVKKGQEIVEIADGSDTIWFGIVPIKKE